MIYLVVFLTIGFILLAFAVHNKDHQRIENMASQNASMISQLQVASMMTQHLAGKSLMNSSDPNN